MAHRNKFLADYGFHDPVNLPIKTLEEIQMGTIRDNAKKYESPQTLNIADLSEVSTELDITTKTYTNSEGEEFTVDEITVDGKKYRVPYSVLKQLKGMLEEKPDVVKFKVKKTGTGLSTSYQVIPLD